MTASTANVYEGAATVYTLTASAAATTATTVDFSVVPGNSTAADQGTSTTNLNDFAAGAFNPTTATIAVGALTTTYTVTSATDSLTELPESYSVKAVTGTTTLATAITSLLDGAVAGSIFTLTNAGDTLTPTSVTATSKTTSGDDTFRATATGDLTSADYIDAGAGTDTLNATVTANATAIAPTLANLENITLTVTGANATVTTFNATNVTGVTNVTIKDAVAISQSAYSALVMKQSALPICSKLRPSESPAVAALL